jgi:hypothetical protein
MTSLWGPMGWMTLHSVSYLYPERPSHADKEILKRYMELFRDTITCIHCHNHFKIVFQNYTSLHPEWANSRFDFFLFVSRAHNTVNARLNKPKPDSVQNCISAFQSNTVVTSTLTYRTKYIEYLIRTWGMEMSGDSMIKVGLVRELKRITEEYWNKKTDTSTSSFNMNSNVLDLIADGAPTSGTLSSVVTRPMNIGFRGGRFQLRR